ncbi:hypothetical protein, partial [Streptomyces sp. cg35]|uniref:hypothetical protein n=1 Tax=Streptomyces sp. cg35 TaxID=3421650 RepID=UPI003D16FAC1
NIPARPRIPATKIANIATQEQEPHTSHVGAVFMSASHSPGLWGLAWGSSDNPTPQHPVRGTTQRPRSRFHLTDLALQAMQHATADTDQLAAVITHGLTDRSATRLLRTLHLPRTTDISVIPHQQSAVASMHGLVTATPALARQPAVLISSAPGVVPAAQVLRLPPATPN